MRKLSVRPRLLLATGALTLGLSGVCSAAAPPSLQPAGWDDDIRLKEAPDRNPDPRIVEVDLDARVATVQVAGQQLEAWTYNGSIPGPLIRARVGDAPAYLTFDIDCLDPAFAPGTGTPVVGGLSTASALRIVRGLAGLNIVGFDVVEVSPAYDHAQLTTLAGATLALEFLYLRASWNVGAGTA